MNDAQPTQPNTVFFVLGGPGSGKTLSCVHLAKTFGYTHFSAGHLLRQASTFDESEVAKQIRCRLMIGIGVPDKIAVDVIREAIMNNPNSNGYIIDGFPRTIEQARMFEEGITPAVGLIYLDCSKETMEKRVQAQGQGNSKQEENNLRAKEYLNICQHDYMPVLNLYKDQGRYYNIDADQDTNKVCEDLVDLLLCLKQVRISGKSK